MPNTDDYLKRYNERTQGNGYQPSSATDDYYQMAKNQEYDLLFDKEVALENAKANAMKYTQNTINAQGFGSTGYGNTLQSGIYNTYLNRANEAQVNYANNIRDINQQQMQADEAKANDRFASVTTMLQGADSVDNMNQLLTDYGYGKVEDGQFVWNKTKPEGMSDDDWYQMQYYYRMQKNAFDQENGQPDEQWAQRVLQTIEANEGDGVSYNSFVNEVARTEQFNIDIEGKDELKDFYVTANNGDVAQFTNGDESAYFIFYNGKLYRIDASLLGGREPKVTVKVKKK